ncbi:MAG: CBS domain-containing protein [Bradymonadaceae bacterium]|nr:CBS domain-containing protein [Lujinxingiaceae bacterium]
MLVQDIMTPAPAIAQLSTSIREVLQIMRDYEARHLPIVDSDEVVGIISDRDLAFLHASPEVFAALSPEDIEEVLERPISSVLKTRFLVDQHVITIRADESVTVAIQLLIDNRISCLPVLTAGTHHIVGIITPVDILDAAMPLFAAYG